MAISTDETFRARLKVEGDASGELKKVAAAAVGAVEGFGAVAAKIVTVNQALELMKKVWDVASEAVKRGFDFTVVAAAHSETAHNRLRIALANVGITSEGTLDSISRFATKMRDLAGIDDDVIKSIIATNVQIGMTVPQAQEAAEAAAGLAQVNGVDIVSANQMLIGSLSGMTREMQKTVPGVAGLTLAQKRHGDAIKMAHEATKAYIAGDAATTEGVLRRLKLAWDDLGKAAGTYALQGASLGDKLAPLREALDDIAKVVEANRDVITKLGRELTTEAVQALVSFAHTFMDLAPILPDIARDLVNLTKMAIIPFVEVILSAVSVTSLLTGNLEKMRKADHALEVLKEGFNNAGAEFFGLKDRIEKNPVDFNKAFPGIDLIAEKLKKIKLPGFVPGASDAGSRADAAADKFAADNLNTGKINLPLTDAQIQARKAAERTLTDQVLAIDRGFFNEQEAAHATNLDKLREMQEDANKDGIDISQKLYDARRAEDRRYFADVQKAHRDDVLAAASASGDVLEIAKAQYESDIAAHRAARQKIHSDSVAQDAADRESARKLLEARLGFDAKVAEMTGDSARAAVDQYDLERVAIERMGLAGEDYAKAMAKAQATRDAGVAAGPINDLAAKLTPAMQMPMLAAVDKLADVIQGLIDFIPGLLEKIAGIFNSLTTLPLKLAAGIADVFKSILNVINNLIPNIGKMVEKIMMSIADFIIDLPDAIGRLEEKIPEIITKIIQRLPEVVQKLIVGLIEGAPKMAYGMVMGFIHGIPMIAHEMVRLFATELPSAIATAIRQIAKDFGAMLTGKFKFPKIDATPITKALDRLNGSSAALFKVEDFKAAAKGVDIGARIAQAAQGAAVNLGNFFADLWKHLVQAIKDAWQWVMDKIITPIVTIVQRAWQWVVDHIITPLATIVSTAFQWVVDHVLVPLGTFVATAFQWVIDKVITPILTVGQRAFQWVVDNVLTPFANIGQKAFQWVFDNVVAPLKKVGEIFSGFKLPTFSWPSFPKFSWPSIPSFSFPSLPTFRWPSFPSFTWPAIPKPDLSIPRPGWLDNLATGGPVGALSKIGGALNTAASHATVSNAKKAISKGHLASGGEVRNGLLYASTGTAVVGTDTVPAMLTPGEFVINRHAAGRIGIDMLESMNRGIAPGGGGPRINVALTVNTTQPIDGAFIRGKLVPVLMDAIKSASESGRYVMSAKGVRT